MTAKRSGPTPEQPHEYHFTVTIAAPTWADAVYTRNDIAALVYESEASGAYAPATIDVGGVR